MKKIVLTFFSVVFITACASTQTTPPRDDRSDLVMPTPIPRVTIRNHDGSCPPGLVPQTEGVGAPCVMASR